MISRNFVHLWPLFHHPREKNSMKIKDNPPDTLEMIEALGITGKVHLQGSSFLILPFPLIRSALLLK